jgi:hypothetical protein
VAVGDLVACGQNATGQLGIADGYRRQHVAFVRIGGRSAQSWSAG